MKWNGYKETEMGAIPEEWNVARLGDYCAVQNGFPFESEQFSETEGTPLIRVRSLKAQECDIKVIGEYDPQFSVKDGDVLIGMDGDFQPCWWKGGNALLNQRVCRLKDFSEQLHPFYAFQSVKKPLRVIEDYTGATTVKHISSRQIADIRIPLPPLPEQKKIATILSKIQQAIEVQEKIIERTKELKKALMAKLFTEGLHGEELKETEIGLMPKNWELVRLGEIADFKNGVNFSSSQKGRGLLTVDVLNMYTDTISPDLTNLYRVDVTPREEYYLQSGDILFVRSSLKLEGVGWSALFENHTEPVTFCGFIIRTRLKTTKLKPEFLVNYMRLPHIRRLLISKSDKVAIANINQGNLGATPVPVPTDSEQMEIVEALTAIDKKLSSLRRKAQSHRMLFRAMLHQLMTGQIRVNNIEIPFDA